jgi:cytochrome c oxidase assembly protein subunit 15
MVLLTVVIGGVTRLTESGLSITEWKPVSGVLPPLNATEWEAEFAKYRQIPEYQEINSGMDLAGFKQIFLVEYVHRLWARLVGVAFAIPFFVFLLRKWTPAGLRGRLWGLLVLLGIQGFMGWYMVQSGLADRTDVSQYRLAAHLGLALVIFGITLWTSADLLDRGGRRGMGGPGTGMAVGFATLVFVTVMAGAFVAGLDAGKAYNTFPLMGGRVVPLGYLQMNPWYRNLFEHLPAVQFNHRLLGLLTLVAAGGIFWRNRLAGPGSAWADWIGVAALAQVGLGVATLLLVVPIPLAAAHQAGAVILLGLALLHWRSRGSGEPQP